MPSILCISNRRDISWRLLGVKSKILWPYGNVPSRTCLRKHFLHMIWQGHFLTVSGFSKIRWPYGNVPVGFALESLNSIWFGKDICWRSVDFRISAPETVRKCPFSNFKAWCPPVSLSLVCGLNVLSSWGSCSSLHIVLYIWGMSPSKWPIHCYKLHDPWFGTASGLLCFWNISFLLALGTALYIFCYMYIYMYIYIYSL